MHYVVGVEIGGTFTDLIVVGDGRIVETVKVPSTPSNPAVGALEGLAKLSMPLKTFSAVVHGSTIATNAVLERKGAVTALLTTRGFRDILEIQSEERDHIYDLHYRKPKPLVTRDLVVPVRERINGADGSVIEGLDVESLTAELDRVVERKVESIAVCFLNAYLNPAHEQEVLNLIESRYPGVFVSLSSDVLPEFREYYRASTTVINAFVSPIVHRYVSDMGTKIRDELFEGDFIMMQSNGGVLPAEAARTHGAWILLSGPAAGTVAAARIAQEAGYENVVSLDMGGTSTDVCLIKEGTPTITTESEIDGLPVRLPMVDIVTIGAGGGSIALMDEGGMLKVGPQSAGADPGPACYGRGGNMATVTDANVVRGLIRPESFVGGSMPLMPDRALAVYSELGKRIGGSAEDAAEAVYKVVNANMAQAVRLVTVSRGNDPRDFWLVAFGGAGPLHAAALAGELGVPGVLVPRHPGLLSAYGLLVADFRRDYVQTQVSRITQIEPSFIVGIFDQLENKGHAEFNSYRSGVSAQVLETALDMRYRGQAYELRVPVSREELQAHQDLVWLARRFHAVHLQCYGHSSPRDEVEIVSYRVTIGSPGAGALYGGLGNGDEDAGRSQDHVEAVAARQGDVFIGGKWTPASYYDRDAMRIGSKVEGPCVIEEVTSTTYVTVGWQATVDHQGNLLLTRRT